MTLGRLVLGAARSDVMAACRCQKFWSSMLRTLFGLNGWPRSLR